MTIVTRQPNNSWPVWPVVIVLDGQEMLDAGVLVEGGVGQEAGVGQDVDQERIGLQERQEVIDEVVQERQEVVQEEQEVTQEGQEVAQVAQVQSQGPVNVVFCKKIKI